LAFLELTQHVAQPAFLHLVFSSLGLVRLSRIGLNPRGQGGLTPTKTIRKLLFVLGRPGNLTESVWFLKPNSQANSNPRVEPSGTKPTQREATMTVPREATKWRREVTAGMHASTPTSTSHTASTTSATDFSLVCCLPLSRPLLLSHLRRSAWETRSSACGRRGPSIPPPPYTPSIGPSILCAPPPNLEACSPPPFQRVGRPLSLWPL
jgi:hypothetical protein